MRTTQLPLPPATATNRVAQTPQGLAFTRSDHADTSRLNHVLWTGPEGRRSALSDGTAGSEFAGKPAARVRAGGGEFAGLRRRITRPATCSHLAAIQFSLVYEPSLHST